MNTKPEILAALAAYWDLSLNNETIDSPLRMEKALRACQQTITGLQGLTSDADSDSTEALTDCQPNTNVCSSPT